MNPERTPVRALAERVERTIASRQAAGAGDTRCLETRVGGRDVRIETRSGRRHGVHRHRCSGAKSILQPIGDRPRADLPHQLRVRRAEVRRAARGAVVAVAGGRRARMEPARARECLTQERGADDDALAANQRPARPVAERELRGRRHGERVEHADEQREAEEDDHRRSELAAHHDIPIPVRTTSMSLIPTNGATSPPTPNTKRFRRRRAAARQADSVTPRSASGISATMIERVENDRREDRRSAGSKVHDVQRGRAPGTVAANIAGMIAKYFATSFEIEKVVSDAPRDEELLADLDDLDELRRIRVEVDHVPRLLGGLCPGVHGHTDVGLCERRSIVRPIARHRHEPSFRLLAPDQRDFVLRRRLRQELVHACFVRDRRGHQGIVARDHHRADPHLAASRRSARACRSLMMSFRWMTPRARPLSAKKSGVPPEVARSRGRPLHRSRKPSHRRADQRADGVSRALAHRATGQVHTAHPGLSLKGTSALQPRGRCSRKPTAPLRGRRSSGLRASRRRGRRVAQRPRNASVMPRRGEQLARLTIPERDRAGLVEQQDVEVARCLDGPA